MKTLHRGAYKRQDIAIKTGDLTRTDANDFFHVVTKNTKNHTLYAEGQLWRVSVAQKSFTAKIVACAYMPLEDIPIHVARNYADLPKAVLIDKLVGYGLHRDTLAWCLHFAKCDGAGQLKSVPTLSLTQNQR